jgi:hypothetical protein
MGYGIDPAITAAAGTPVDTYGDVSAALYSYVTPPTALTYSGSYSGLTWIGLDNLSLPQANCFYTIHHRPTGVDPGDYFAVIVPRTSNLSTVYDLKPMSYQGGAAATNLTGGNSGYSALTYVSGSVGTGYAADSMYYLRQDGLGNTWFGQMIPALTGGSTDFLNLTTAVGSFSSFGAGNNAMLTWATGAVGSNAAGQFYYLRQDASVANGGTGNTILGVLNPSLTAGTRTISDISNLGGVFNAITFIAGATGPASTWGTANYFYVSGAIVTGAVSGNGQSVNLAAIADQTLTATPSPFTVTPAASSGLPITLTVASSSTGTATITGPLAGVFTVTPTGPGIVTLKANQAGSSVYAANFLEQSFNVIGVPLITSPTTASGAVGTTFSTYNIVAASSTSILSYSATGLPSGLSVNTATGAITGTPSAAGVTIATLTATNATGASLPVALKITIVPASSLPVITSALIASGAVSTTFVTYNITAASATSILSYSATGLPAGLSVNTSTGAITGTPTGSGVSNVTLTATNAVGTSLPVTLTITVVQTGVVPVITSALTAPGAVGTTFQTYAITAASSSPILSYSASGLPAGLVVNASSGTITGTPTVANVYIVTLTATNAIGASLPVTLTITIVPTGVVPVITSALTAPGTVGTTFVTYAITAASSSAILSYSSTSLPPGLALNTLTGAITGTPTVANTYNVTLTVTNSVGPSFPATLVVTIAAASTPPIVIVTPVTPPATPPPVTNPGTEPGTISSPSTAVGTVGTVFVTYPIVATGSPTSYSATGLPPGLTLNTVTGRIDGTPTTPGTYVVTISATNASGTSSTNVTMVIATPISVAVAADLVNALTTVNANPNGSYTITFTASVTLAAGNTLPAIITSGTTTINGANFTLDGGGVQRGFFVSSGTVVIENLTIQNTLAQGGNGANGGGGGMGAGGALLMLPGTNVTLSNVILGTSGKPDQALGGNGGASGATGGAGGGINLGGFAGGTGASGATGGTGAFGGGGGGSNGGAGGLGGLGGGGGGGTSAGLAGFGGGNGSATGTTSSTGLGGGGMGAGGAIFASGGNLTITGPITVSGNKVTAGTAGGTGAIAGSAFGTGIFLSGNDSNNGGSGALLTFAPVAGQTQSVSDVIADQAGNGGTGSQFGVWGLTLNGAGVLNLTGANTFSGGVTVSDGVLGVNNTSGSGSGLGPVTVASGATVAGTGKIGSGLTLQAGSFFAPGTGVGTLSVGGSATWNGTAEGLYTLSDDGISSSVLAVTGALTKAGSGTYVFNFQNSGAAPDTYTLATYGSTNFIASNFSYTGLPTGLTGTFTVGATQLQFSAVAAAGGSGSSGSAPVVTSSGAASGTSGTAFTYNITATNSPTSYGMSGALPTGLTLNTNTGVISGTPTQTGTFTVTIGATNSSGSGTASLVTTVAAAAVTAPASPAPAASSGSGGGGAPSTWFYLALALVLIVRQSLQRQKKYSA